MVIANVPRTFQIRLDDHSTREIKAGTQRLPRKHAEHWYARNHGVTIVSNAARATVGTAPRTAGAGPMTDTQKEVSQLQAAAGAVQAQPGAEGGPAGEWPGSPGATDTPVVGGPASGAQTAGQPAPVGAGSPVSPQGPSEAGLRTATSEAQFRESAAGKPGEAAVEATRAAVSEQGKASEAGAPRDAKAGQNDGGKSGKKS